MQSVIYLGDELSAAAYRLAGAQVLCPAPREATRMFTSALAQASLVLVSAALVAAIDAAALRQAACALRPLVLVVPDLVGDTPLPDLAARLRGQLGLEA